ncbi:helix-turn-helix transcriptional regulator [Bdellovibrionota bacterium FG-2]
MKKKSPTTAISPVDRFFERNNGSPNNSTLQAALMENRIMTKEAKRPRRGKVQGTLASNLSRLLKERNLTHRAAAEIASVSASTIADWASGAQPADLHKVAALATGLGVSFEYLCLGTHGNQTPDQIPLEVLFEEHDSGLEGIYRISAKRLIRKTGSGRKP